MSKAIKDATRLFITGQVRNVGETEKEVAYHEFVLSNESVDRHGTVFKSQGWDLTRYNQNPVVTYIHEDDNPNPDLVIGTGEIFFEGKDMIARVYYEPEDLNPLAEKVKRKVQHGTLRMASVRFNPFEGHFGDEDKGEDRDVLYFDKQELLSWSIVPVGSNRDALKRNAQAIEAIKTEYTRELPVVDAQEIPTQTKTLSIREAQLLTNKNVQ